MKKVIIILLFTPLMIFSCAPISTKEPGYIDSSQVVTSTADEIYNLKIRAYKLEAESASQAKQIAALSKYDSLKTIYINSLNASMTDIRNRYIRDSVYQWNAINKALTIVRFSKDSLAKLLAINKLTDQVNLKIVSVLSATINTLKTEDVYIKKRYGTDSVYQWAAINKLLPLLSLATRYPRDSIYQWLAIKALQGASPVTQIPIMQAKMKTLQKAYDSLQNLINKYARIPDTTQFKTVSGVLTIPALNSLETRVNVLEGMQPPGGQTLK